MASKLFRSRLKKSDEDLLKNIGSVTGSLPPSDDLPMPDGMPPRGEGVGLPIGDYSIDVNNPGLMPAPPPAPSPNLYQTTADDAQKVFAPNTVTSPSPVPTDPPNIYSSGLLRQRTPEEAQAVFAPNTLSPPTDNAARVRDSKLLRQRPADNTTGAPISSADAWQQYQDNKTAPYERHHSFLGRLGSGLFRGLQAWSASGGEGGLAGLAGAALTGGVASSASPGFDAEWRRNTQGQKLLRQVGESQAFEKTQSEKAYRDAQTENIYTDNNQRKTDAEQRAAYLKSEQERKTADRTSREGTARMRTIAGMLEHIPSYDPADPKFKELTEALAGANLPLTAKDVKKKVDLKQDQRTGAWTTIVTDPVTGKQEVRDVTGKDGQQFKTTPTVVMQGELGMLKQNDQQDFQAGENEKNRQHQIELKQMGDALQTKLTEYRTMQQQIRDEKNFERRQELIKQSAALKAEGQELTKKLQLKKVTGSAGATLE